MATTSAVRNILEQIDQLADKDKARLERELSARADAEWKDLTGRARRQARARGIDQSTIDKAVDQVRYNGQ